MTELSFQLPQASIAVEAVEAQRLSEELDRLGTRLTGQDYARAARRVGTATRERSVHAVDLLDVAENEKVLRALEHLSVRDELSPGLVSLWEGLTRDVRPGLVRYRLELARVRVALVSLALLVVASVVASTAAASCIALTAAQKRARRM